MTIVDSIAIMGISSYLISQSRLDNKASKKQSDLFSPQIIGNCLGLLLLTIWYQVSISSKVGNSQLVVICYALLPFGTWIAIHKTRLIINGSLRPVIFETLTNAALRIFMILVYNFRGRRSSTNRTFIHSNRNSVWYVLHSPTVN